MKNLIQLALIGCVALVSTACGTEDIPPGNKGFMFDRTGAFALYVGGEGLMTSKVLSPGTHYTGVYDTVKDVNCKDAHKREQVSVLTKSDIAVDVDIRLTYSADCSDAAKIERIISEVSTGAGTIEPEMFYDLYILPIVRESLRNRLADVTIEDVKTVREKLRDGILADINRSLESQKRPVNIRLVTVSNIKLPKEITEKNREIELARQQAEKERELQEASKYRLERELFEAQQDRKVQNEQAQKLKDVALVDAQRDKEVSILQAEAVLEAKLREAEGVKALRAQLSGPYISYLKVLKDAEVQKATAAAMATGTKWYVGKDFLIPPDNGSKVAVSR